MRTPRGAIREPHSVCLISLHPLVLDDLARMLAVANGQIRVRSHRLPSTTASDLRQSTIPPAAAHVIDGHLPTPALHAVVTGVLQHFPASRLIVLGEDFTESTAFPLLRLGVKGLLPFAETRSMLARTIKIVSSGGVWVPRSLLSRFMDAMLDGGRHPSSVAADTNGISERERQVLEALLDNLSNKEIASKLAISERTVKFHVSNLLTKFGVERRQHLISRCLQVPPAAPPAY
ncbi:MAG: helix-turn-helix domain-containing protein [Vicinamibacteria bacterium]